jgi:hypothetical protein
MICGLKVFPPTVLFLIISYYDGYVKLLFDLD